MQTIESDKKPGTLSRQFLQLGSLSFIMYPLGFLMQMLMSYYFGTTSKIDAYLVATTVITLFRFYEHPVREALVSGYHSRLRSDPDDASVFYSSTINAFFLLLTASCLLLLLFPGSFADLIIDHNKRALHDEVLRLLYISIPLVPLIALTEVLNGVLVSVGRIFFQDIGRTVGYLLAVLFLIFFAGKMGISAMIFAAITTNILLLAVQLISMKDAGPTYRLLTLPRFEGAFLRMSGALILSYLVAQMYSFFERNVFVGFQTGMLAAFQYAMSLTNVLYAVCIGSICTVISPRLFVLQASRDEDGIVSLLLGSMKNILVVIVFAVVVLWSYAETVVYLVFCRGAFGIDSVAVTAGFFRATLFSLPFLAVSAILGRFFVADQRTRPLFFIGILSAVGGAAMLCLSRLTGNSAVAGYHYAVSALFGCAVAICSVYSLCRRPMNRNFSRFFWWLAKGTALSAAIALFFSIFPLPAIGEKLPLLLETALRAACGAVLFFGMAYYSGLCDMVQLPGLLRKKVAGCDG